MSADLSQSFGPILPAIHIGPCLKSELNVGVYGAPFLHDKVSVHQAVAYPLVVGRDHRIEEPAPLPLPTGKVFRHRPIRYEHDTAEASSQLHHVTL